MITGMMSIPVPALRALLPALSFLLFTQHDPALLTADSCLSRSYFGQYGQESAFIVNEACLASLNSLLSAGSITPLPDHELQGQQVVWLAQKAIDASLGPAAPVEEVLRILNNAQDFLVNGEEKQVTMGEYRQLPTVLQIHTGPLPSMVIAASPDTVRILDTYLPPFWTYKPLPPSPIELKPISPAAVDRVKSILVSVKYDPAIASIVGSISLQQLHEDIRYLTGEDPASGLVSRHSFSQGAREAAVWLKKQFEATGASCELKPFLTGFAPNVICKYTAIEDTTETVLLSAHYDSRGSFGSTRAPGGDDDGSGTIALLSIAHAIARRGVAFRKNVQLCAFAGEEQGLLGSKAYARELYDARADLTLMIQADMLGYHVPGEPAQLGLPETIGSVEVMQLVSNISAIYSPELSVGFTAACCSDHQSFHELGYPATQVFERAGPIADPMYHNSGDVSDREGYDFEQIRSIAKVQFAALLHSAGFVYRN
ncbi:Zn-dependent exopeptidase [Wolfiporia cocos MD-104 SS10]|uniref:Peptide hydrolase n=1 Tax=Wolfiporia cocos (strain MD-104) TaxID=742152 RepID=A0A2H3JYF9_WOLCO|nr:Zn-dependent exopeptidase [Wolfiporia cocos MD-104 SS10]